MAKRMSDTAAVKNMPSPSGELGSDTSVSVSVRKIDNGFVTREARYGNGEYTEKETYTPTTPNLSVKDEAAPQASSTLRRTIDYMQ